MKRIYNLLLIFALVLVGGFIGANSVNATNDKSFVVKEKGASVFQKVGTHSDDFDLSVYSYGEGTVDTYWDEVPGATYYDVCQGNDNYDFEVCYGTDENEFTFEYLEGDKGYTFQVLAYSDEDDDDPIAYSSIEYEYVYSKLDLNIQVNGTNAQVSWSQNKDADFYELTYGEEDTEGTTDEDYYWKENGDGDTIQTTNTSYTIKNLKENTRYLFTVSACRNKYYGDDAVQSCHAFSDVIRKITGKAAVDISKATVTGITNKKYNGKAQTQNVRVINNNVLLGNGKDYTISYKKNINAGTATMTITGKGQYTGTITKTFTISKIKNPIKVTAKNKKVKYKKLKKKKQVITSLNVTKAQGKVTYAKVSGNKRFKINETTGKITVKKKTKKGTYYLKFKVTAAGNANYKAASKTLTMKVIIK